MERLADDLVGDVRTVEIARVDMIDPARHRLAQHRDRTVAILGRAEHAGAGKLHRAIAEPPHGAAAEGERSGGIEIGHGKSPWDRSGM